MKIADFTAKYIPLARQAEKAYHLNALFIMAQSAVESGWGGSHNCRAPYRNFFGITAGNYWTGRTRKIGRTGLIFRCYDSDLESFNDFARLITTHYLSAAGSTTLSEYAHHIAYSPYISESNGDNRPRYEKNILWAGEKIAAIINPNV